MTLASVGDASTATPVRWVTGKSQRAASRWACSPCLLCGATSRDPITSLATAREALLSGDHSVIGVDDAHLLNQLSAAQPMAGWRRPIRNRSPN